MSMKNKKLLLFFQALALVLITSCTREEKIKGYTETDTHLFYKLLAIGDGKKNAKSGDWLVMEAIYRTQDDSVFWDSRHDVAGPYYLVFKDRCQTGCFNEYFPKMAEGDSLSFLVKKEAFYKEIFNSAIPVFSEKDSVVKAELKLLKITDASSYPAYLAEFKRRKEEAGENEYSQMDKYATENFNSDFLYKNGMYIQFVKRTSDSLVKKGAEVTLSYKGYHLDGRLVDYTPGDKPFEIIYGEKDQLLQGLQYGISLMKKGESAKFILPSHLAFGEQGSSDGSIAPHSPLVYEVEIINVK
ncbi:MAG: FKBP-type peptidyl-prolyl cis-trans isomerase [Bacteroidia bacterium]